MGYVNAQQFSAWTRSMFCNGVGTNIDLGLGRWNTISFVFDNLIDSLLSQAHFCTHRNSSSILKLVISGTSNVASSAYFAMWFVTALALRFNIMIMKRQGPMPEPWTMKRLMNCSRNKLPPTFVYCDLFVRNEIIQVMMLWLKPYCLSLLTNLMVHTIECFREVDEQVVEMVLGWHGLLLWRENEGWWVICSKEKVQHYEKIYRRIWVEKWV